MYEFSECELMRSTLDQRRRMQHNRISLFLAPILQIGPLLCRSPQKRIVLQIDYLVVDHRIFIKGERMFSCKAVFFRLGYFLGLWFPFSCIFFWVLYVSISGRVRSSDWSRVETSICRQWNDLKSLMHSLYNIAALRMWMTQNMDTNFWSFRTSFDNKGDVTVEYSYIVNIFWEQRCWLVGFVLSGGFLHPDINFS